MGVLVLDRWHRDLGTFLGSFRDGVRRWVDRNAGALRSSATCGDHDRQQLAHAA
jgi:hypothetical protein